MQGNAGFCTPNLMSMLSENHKHLCFEKVIDPEMIHKQPFENKYVNNVRAEPKITLFLFL